MPMVTERRIIIQRRRGGRAQYVITLPKPYALRLLEMEIRDLIVVYNGVLVAFPKTPGLTGETLIELIGDHLAYSRLHTDARARSKAGREAASRGETALTTSV
jgi:hypothetical protein